MQTLFYQPGILTGVTHLNPEDSRHCVKVLRKKSGDTIYITDGAGSIAEAVINDASSDRCIFRIQQTIQHAPRGYFFWLAVAPTKNTDRMEWLVEKCVEIGIDRISFIQTVHSERTNVNIERIQKIAVSAMKQALLPFCPVIDPVLSFDQFIGSITSGQRFIAKGNAGNMHLMDSAKAGQACTVLIGPEGDFTDDELSMAIHSGFIPVSLGNSRLRTETAGLSACLTISLINRHLNQNLTQP
ncbi:MAG: 16S rRNA (uracil(1498)-N(3))-methyltransferase [Flammeovirgaceae bacterium]|nr:MAG: 16S rRNA (uracil(1498)-N(3))-methyltransferase [Flammeovirgaceae bacterium]